MREKGIQILVVDDELSHADGIAESLEKFCESPIVAYSGEDAVSILRNQQVDIVITDLKLGGEIDGLAVLEEAKKQNDRMEVILITAYATIDTCKQAIKRGAYDYLVKPIDIDQLRTVVGRLSRKISTPYHLKTKLGKGRLSFQGVHGKSTRMDGIFEILKRVAPTNISVLIEGESGTGKELLAMAIHNNSQRAGKPFKPVNCAGFSETLLESELFGHIKGAFTGATADRKGLFEIADKGTLFLDEIGDMPLNMQAKFLRVIEDGIIIPVGSHKPIVADIRIISATNHDLTSLIEEKKFRQDLYFRIKGLNIVLPALRDRAEDILAFAEFFLKEAVAEVGSKVAGITDAAMAVLMNYDWPGNIRQLRNAIRTMVVMCDRDNIDVQDIRPEIAQRRQLTAGSPQDAYRRKTAADLGAVSLNEMEKQAIMDTLAMTRGNREKAAKILGIGERTLYRKIKEYGL